MIQVIDRDNWTGEKTNVRINQKALTFKFHLGNFYLQPVGAESDYFLILEKGSQRTVGSVFAEKNQWVAIDSDYGDLSRSAATAIEAAVKLICNLR